MTARHPAKAKKARTLRALEKAQIRESAALYKIADVLSEAWMEYVFFFSGNPHGTVPQLRALLHLKGAGRKILAIGIRHAAPARGKRKGGRK